MQLFYSGRGITSENVVKKTNENVAFKCIWKVACYWQNWLKTSPDIVYNFRETRRFAKTGCLGRLGSPGPWTLLGYGPGLCLGHIRYYPTACLITSDSRDIIFYCLLCTCVYVCICVIVSIRPNHNKCYVTQCTLLLTFTSAAIWWIICSALILWNLFGFSC